MTSKILCVLLVLLFSAPVHSVDEVFKNYKEHFDAGLSVCTKQLNEAIAIEKTKLNGTERYDLPEQFPPDWKGCIGAKKSAAKPLYETALKALKKSSAKTALKEHYIASLSGLDEIAPKYAETVEEYRRRQSSNDQKRNDAWVRFEVER